MRRLPVAAPLILALTMIPALAAPAAAPASDAEEALRLAQPPATADMRASLDYAQTLRSAAHRLIRPDSADPAQLRMAVALFEKDIAYLSTPAAYRYGTDGEPLSAYAANLLIPLAETYARLGMKEQALASLEKLRGIVLIPPVAKDLAGSVRLAGLREEPRFKMLVAAMRQPRLLDAGLATPYREELSEAERIAGLSLFWSEARQNFVYFDHIPELDWNQVYLDYLPRVIAARTTREYYRVLMELAPLLHDGHTNIYAPEALGDEFYSRPPMRTALIENRVMVEQVGNEALARQVHVGDEIVAIDGLPAQQYARERVTPYVSASTPQDLAMRSFSYQLLAGDAAKPVKLRLRAADGAEREEVIARGGVHHVSPRFAFNMLPDGVAYIAIDHFESAEAVKQFEQALPQILKAKALIIDVRRNGGGSSNFGLSILSWLSREPVRGTVSFVRYDHPYLRAAGARITQMMPLPSQPYVEKHEQVFSGPVALLTGAQTFSAAEDFAAAFRIMKRGIIVGEATGGSTGQPLMFKLPGGGSARICIKRDTYPDGTEFVGKGIIPDIEVHPTIAALRGGSDPVLERAAAELRKL